MKDISLNIQDLLPDNITCSYHGVELNIQDDMILGIGILIVSGVYPNGSAGASVGAYIDGISVFVREYYNLNDLILDFSELDYQWGNNLLSAASPRNLLTPSDDLWLGYKIVGSKKNREALYGLFCDFGKSSGIKKIYTSVDDAMQDIVVAGKELYKDSG